MVGYRWWHKGVLHYELLKPSQTITEDRYRQQLLRLNEEMEQKRPFTGKGKRPIKLLHDNVSNIYIIMLNNNFYKVRYDFQLRAAFQLQIK